MMEIWKDIIGYEGHYQISNLGRVKSLKSIHKEMILATRKDKQGYIVLSLHKNARKGVKLHRLIAQCFVPNPENKREVNHKNGIKSDNRIENLEWCTRNENVKHAYATGLRKNSDLSNKRASEMCKKRIGALSPVSRTIINIQTGIFYDSMKEAAEIHEMKLSFLADALTRNKINKTSLRYA